MNEKIIKNSQEIEDALKKLSKVLNKHYHKTPIDLIYMNHAAKHFVEDLLKQLEIDVRVQNLNFQNYQDPSESGEVRISQDLEFPIFDRHVILADGILISGKTHFYVCNYLKQRFPKSLSILCIGYKPELLTYKIPNIYSLFSFKDEWIEGYGIGSKEHSDQKYLIDLKKS